MYKCQTYILSALLLITAPAFVIAACPDPNTVTTVPKLMSVEINARVEHDSRTGIFNYAYDIKNGKLSTGCIWRFEVDIKRPQGGASLSNAGLVNSEFVSLGVRSKDGSEMIPVAYPVLPAVQGQIAWSAGLHADGLASWGSNRYIYQIAPGERMPGFQLATHGLPAIRDCKVEPKYIAEDEDVYKMGVSEKDYVGDPAKYLFAFYDSLAWKGKTIAPTAPPEIFKPLEFVDYLISIKHEAAALGWIRNDGVMKSLDAKLESAKKKIGEGQMGAAKNILGAFISEVEAQGCATYENCPAGKHLTSEAYALLKYNAQYLMDNLSR